MKVRKKHSRRKKASRRPARLLAPVLCSALGLGVAAHAANYEVRVSNDDGTGGEAETLSWAIRQANVNPGADTVTLITDVTLIGVMKTLIDGTPSGGDHDSGGGELTIESESTIRHSISGGDQFRPLFVKSGTVTIQNVDLINGKAKGGNGRYGGGGAGLGGALFVYDGNVTVEDVVFSGNKAEGGNGGDITLGGAGGGGGMFGNGGFDGGGGLFASSTGNNGGYGGYGSYGGGGSAAYTTSGFGAGGFRAGNGGFGGGGGISMLYWGRGGFGGGGGYGGNGGFGGGGGATGFTYTGSGFGGYGGGDGNGSFSGGGGASFGGAIFAMNGTVTLTDVTFSGNTVTAGTGADPGTTGAADVFICTSQDMLCGATVNACGTTATSAVIGTFGSDCGGTEPTGPLIVDAGGICTLPDAITAANTDAVTGGCPAGISGQDTIFLEIDVTLSAALPNITSAIVIEGQGHTVNGNNGAWSVLTVDAAGDLTLNKATVTGGNTAGDGGGINSSGTLTLNQSTVIGNTAVNIGGGINNWMGGTATLNNSTVSGNSSDEGGGVGNEDGTVTLNNSTVTDNTAGTAGGGIQSMSGTSTALNNSLVSGNSVTAGSGNEITAGGTVTADSYNVFGHSGETDADAFSGSFTPGSSDIDATSDGTNTPLASILNMTLADNGGPTQTHALPAGSPAIDLDPACSTGLMTDQRGYGRPVGAGCDAGSFEFDTVPPASPCGSGRALPDHTWMMTAPSCTPVTNTVVDQYGDDLGDTSYNSTWILYQYNTSTQANDALTAGSSLTLGDGNWTLSNNAGTLDLSGTATPTEDCSTYGGGGQCFALDLTGIAPNNFVMIGNPFPYAVNWGDVGVACKNGTWTVPAHSASAAEGLGIIDATHWTYNGSSYDTSDAGTLEPQYGYFIYTLGSFQTACPDGVKLLFPAQ